MVSSPTVSHKITFPTAHMLIANSFTPTIPYQRCTATDTTYAVDAEVTMVNKMRSRFVIVFQLLKHGPEGGSQRVCDTPCVIDRDAVSAASLKLTDESF